jgi:hypothetical protein
LEPACYPVGRKRLHRRASRVSAAFSIFDTQRRNQNVHPSSNRRQSCEFSKLNGTHDRYRKANRQPEFFKIRTHVQGPHRAPRRGERLEKHVEGYIEAYAPVGLPERDLVRNIAENHFRLQRAHGLEHALVTQLISEQPDNLDPASAEAEIWEQKARELKNVSLQAGRIQRAIEKSTAALNAMQAQRKSAYAKAEAEAILLTQLAHAKGQTVDAAKDFLSPEQCGGFVFSLPEIARLIGRAARLAEANARFQVAQTSSSAR